MNRCAFLTYDRAPDITADDRLAIPHLERLGWTIEAVPWRQAVALASGFDAMVLRSAWDYHRHLDEFLDVITRVEQAGVRLFNAPSLVRWNAAKSYLRDLDAQGFPTVPTVYRDGLANGTLHELFDELGADDIVVKPLVSASAEGTERVDRHISPDRLRTVEEHFATRELMAQPVARAVLDEGEYSLIYLGGSFSHAIRKTPKHGDFRVQEAHGGMNRPAEPDPSQLSLGTAVIDSLLTSPLYARVDIVKANDADGWWLMELELVEPALYLALGAGAPERFARAIDLRVRDSAAEAVNASR